MNIECDPVVPMTETDALARQSLPAQIKERLLAQITSGTLKPGDRLIELKIASEMDTSQAPVREALRELETIGVVETRRNKGSRVRAISPEELRDIYEVRAELEGFAAELAARSGASIKTELMKTVAKMRQAARSGNTLAFAQYNTDFHRCIVAASRNIVLLDHWNRLDIQFRSALNMVQQDLNLTDVAESHLPIVEAIDTGNAKAARKLAKAHVLENRPAQS